MNNSSDSSPKSGFGPKQVILVFLLVLVGYMGVYHWIEYRRHFKGPWELQFTADAAGTPSLVIHQTGLKLDKQIQFIGETVSATNLPETVLVASPGLDTPFGRIIYEDLTFLPGVVTFNLFGHEIELMPRVMLINKKEVAWDGEPRVVVRPEEKPLVPPAPPKGGTRDQQP